MSNDTLQDVVYTPVYIRVLYHDLYFHYGFVGSTG